MADFARAILEREYVQQGSVSLARQLAHHKLQELDLSPRKELEHFPLRRGVTTLDVEVNEGRYLLSGSLCGVITIHDLHRRSSESNTCPSVCKIRPPTDKQSGVFKLQWYPHDTGMFTSSGADNLLKVWDTNALVVAEQFRFKGRIHTHAVAKAKAHCLVAVGNAGDSYVTLCDLLSGASTHILKGHSKPVISLDWSPSNDHLLVSGSEDNRILMWDIRRATGPVATFDQHNGANRGVSSSVLTAHSGIVTGVRYTRDGLFVVSCGSDDRVKLWDGTTGQNTMVNYGKVRPIAKGPCCFALSAYSWGADPVICVPLGTSIAMYDVERGTKLKVLRGHFGQVHCCVFHPFDVEMYSSGAESSILVWAPKQKIVRTKSVKGGTQLPYEDHWSSDEDN